MWQKELAKTIFRKYKNNLIETHRMYLRRNLGSMLPAELFHKAVGLETIHPLKELMDNYDYELVRDEVMRHTENLMDEVESVR
jgi:hypothetical protein